MEISKECNIFIYNRGFQKDITVENVLKAFNEIVTLSTSIYSYVDIQDYISKPTQVTEPDEQQT